MNNQIFLESYKQRSIFDSNCIEFWAPVTSRVVPNVIEGRYWVSTFGNTCNSNTGRPIGLSMHRKGYKQFSMMTNDGRQVTRKLHRLIMMLFCYFPGCEDYEVNHKDGNKLNNYILNLEWTTHSENTIHAINMGLKTVFGNNTVVKLTDEDVSFIVYSYTQLGKTPTEIHKEILRKYPGSGIRLNLIGNICRGQARISYHNNLYELHD